MVYLYERCGNTMLVANILIVAKSLFVVNSNVVANNRIYQALGFRNFHCVGCARFRPTCVLQCNKQICRVCSPQAPSPSSFLSN